MKFINLHGHSSFSYGDGHKLPRDHVQRVKELGMDAMALTEHGNTSSHVQFEIAATKEGIKPIYGVEAYVAPKGEKRKFHQTILAMDEEGYRQLNRLVTRSWGEGFYYEATVDPEWLLDKEQTS
ncbi:MAG: PHP domain-containing protein, partial [Alphaproteobacteria bacterium]|nr:PHP domain-containing protein [Alphaproteobacteria bacterium]